MINSDELSIVLNKGIVEPVKHKLLLLKQENIELKRQNNILKIWLLIISVLCVFNTVLIFSKISN